MTLLRDLSKSIEKKTLIPFIGAGLSASCGLPTWSKLIDDLVEKFSVNRDLLTGQNDFLRITEYIKIKEGGRIGPIRLEIQELFKSVNVDISNSEPHLLLASLGLPLIYTTNYDNLIEESFSYLGIKYNKIITTRDIVKYSMYSTTQIVKFHGSFEHEELMVLTESDYLNRLELETSLDIKLRSDIIGRSVLFIGYSFSDFNIRYLWFKLRKMMKGIENEDLPKSYILLSESNALNETLFSKIGIYPIILGNYEGNTLTEKLTNFLENIILDSRDNIRSPVAINSQIDKLLRFIWDNDTKNILKYLSLLVDSKFGSHQLIYLKQTLLSSNEFIDSIFDKIEDDALELFTQLLQNIFQKTNDHDIYDALITNFLKYKEVRHTEEMKNYQLLSKLFSGERLSVDAGLNLLWNAIHWLKNSVNLKYDTTLYYVIFIALNFSEQLDVLLYREEPDPNNPRLLSPQPPYYFLTPQLVIDLFYSKAPWLPPIEILVENLGDFFRVCENCRCLLQTDNYKYWEEFENNKIDKIFMNGKIDLS